MEKKWERSNEHQVVVDGDTKIRDCPTLDYRRPNSISFSMIRPVATNEPLTTCNGNGRERSIVVDRCRRAGLRCRTRAHFPRAIKVQRGPDARQWEKRKARRVCARLRALARCNPRGTTRANSTCSARTRDARTIARTRFSLTLVARSEGSAIGSAKDPSVDLTSLAIPSSITLGRVSMRAEEKQQKRDTETRAGSCTWVRAYACTKASLAIRLERRALGLFGASAPIPWRRGDYTGCAPRVRAITMGCQIGPFRGNSPPTRRLRPRSAISFGSLPDRFPSSSSERASERASIGNRT